MLRSGSAIFSKSLSGKLSHSGSGRLSAAFRARGKETRKYNLKICVDALDAASVQGDVVITLDKTDGPMPCTTPIRVVNDASKNTLVKQTLEGQVTLIRGKGAQFKPKLVKIFLKLSSANGPTISSTYINVTDYESVGEIGKKLRIQLENGSSLFVILSCQPLSECVAEESISPTSVLTSDLTPNSMKRSMILQASSSGFLMGKLKAFGSKCNLGPNSPSQNGPNSKQFSTEKSTPLQELQTENSRLYKLLTVTKEGLSKLDEVRTENETLKNELASLKENSVPSDEYHQLVRELCMVREARAAVELDKQTLEHTLKTLNERQRCKGRKSRWH